MKECPWCAEQIQDSARLCRFCNRSVVADAPPRPLESGGNYGVPFRFDRQETGTAAGGGGTYSSAGLAVAGNVCPTCASATYTSTYSLWHGVLAIFVFPLGLLAFAFPIKKCANCSTVYGAGLAMTRTLGIVALVFAALVLLLFIAVISA